MDTILHFITVHAIHAHWIIFFLIILAGFNLPISEDALIIFGAISASQFVPENTFKILGAILLSCFIADNICYSIGRFFSTKIEKIPFIKKVLTAKRIGKIGFFYKKFGTFTILLGRFIPLGVRNAMFLTAGISKMYYLKFIAIDICACIISASTLFTVTYHLGKNYDKIFDFFKDLDTVIFSIFIIAIISFFIYYKIGNKKSS